MHRYSSGALILLNRFALTLAISPIAKATASLQGIFRLTLCVMSCRIIPMVQKKRCAVHLPTQTDFSCLTGLNLLTGSSCQARAYGRFGSVSTYRLILSREPIVALSTFAVKSLRSL